jgi:hypothetical protein
MIRYLCAIALVLGAGEKRAYIITGPESSGSVFVSQVISYVVGKDAVYKQWSGYGMNGSLGDDLIILHLSQPFLTPPQFCNLAKFREWFSGYDLYFIVTTRDIDIVKKSKRHRFGRSKSAANIHQDHSREILEEILRNEKSFIWNYETQVYLGKVYYQLLYDFLQVKTDFFPTDLYNANKKYIKWGH